MEFYISLKARRRKRLFEKPFGEMPEVIRMEYCRNLVSDVSFHLEDWEKKHMEKVMYESILSLEGKFVESEEC